MEINLSSAEWWLIFGFITIISEVLFISGFGLLFVGLGAITIAGVISMNHLMELYQYPLFAIFSFAWFGILWQPLKKYLYSKSKSEGASDMIGQKVEVIRHSLMPGGAMGHVKWSGTILSARLDTSMKQEQKVGAILQVKEVDGSIVVCIKNEE